MFEKISQVAEQAATNVSRRAFLGRLGRAAAGAAGALGGLLLLPGQAEAGRKLCHGITCLPGNNYCCHDYDTVAKKNVYYCSSVPCR